MKTYLTYVIVFMALVSPTLSKAAQAPNVPQIQAPIVPHANEPTGSDNCQSDKDCLIGCPTNPINGSKAPTCIAYTEGDRACLSTQPAPIGGLVCKCLPSQHLCGFTLPE